jgi:hypothetical protein
VFIGINNKSRVYRDKQLKPCLQEEAIKAVFIGINNHSRVYRDTQLKPCLQEEAIKAVIHVVTIGNKIYRCCSVVYFDAWKLPRGKLRW